MKLSVSGTSIQLLPSRALFLEKERVLIVADLHFGKVQHFRRGGLPVPPSAGQKNAEMLIDLINLTRPLQTIFLGDLFHSHYNEDWEVVGQIVKHFPECRFRLILGNHDIMTSHQYARKGIEVTKEERIGPFLLTHEPIEEENIPEGIINVAGHLHPGARLEGRGRQSISLPCFWLSDRSLILPAFGAFTGLYIILPKAGDRIFLVLEQKIMEVGTVSSSQV